MSEIPGEHIKLVDELNQLDGHPLLEVGVKPTLKPAEGRRKAKGNENLVLECMRSGWWREKETEARRAVGGETSS